MYAVFPFRVTIHLSHGKKLGRWQIFFKFVPSKDLHMKYYLTLAVATAVATAAIAQQPHQAINIGFMDNTVRPQDDFYNYVNGNWMKTVDIPSDKARWGSFDELRENTDGATLEILKSALAKPHAKGTDGQKIADLYRSYRSEENTSELQ